MRPEYTAPQDWKNHSAFLNHQDEINAFNENLAQADARINNVFNSLSGLAAALDHYEDNTELSEEEAEEIQGIFDDLTISYVLEVLKRESEGKLSPEEKYLFINKLARYYDDFFLYCDDLYDKLADASQNQGVDKVFAVFVAARLRADIEELKSGVDNPTVLSLKELEARLSWHEVSYYVAPAVLDYICYNLEYYCRFGDREKLFDLLKEVITDATQEHDHNPYVISGLLSNLIRLKYLADEIRSEKLRFTDENSGINTDDDISVEEDGLSQSDTTQSYTNVQAMMQNGNHEEILNNRKNYQIERAMTKSFALEDEILDLIQEKTKKLNDSLNDSMQENFKDTLFFLKEASQTNASLDQEEIDKIKAEITRFTDMDYDVETRMDFDFPKIDAMARVIIADINANKDDDSINNDEITNADCYPIRPFVYIIPPIAAALVLGAYIFLAENYLKQIALHLNEEVMNVIPQELLDLSKTVFDNPYASVALFGAGILVSIAAIDSLIVRPLTEGLEKKEAIAQMVP